MKRIVKELSLTLAAMMVSFGLAGCSQADASVSISTSLQTESMTSVANGAAPEETPETKTEGEREVTLSLLIDSNVSLDGLKAVCESAREKLGIAIEIEYKVDTSVLKTRLAAGEMTDLVVYNSGSLLEALEPSEYFIDLTTQPFANRYDETYKKSVTVDEVVYGVPFTSTQAGAVMYYKPIYEELGLEIPGTWDEFLSNCQKIDSAGYTAYISSTAQESMTQVLFLGDHYNVMASNPDFVREFEQGKVQYASDQAALKSWKKYQDIIPYLQEEHTTTTYDEACRMLAEGRGAHWICLTQALSNIYSLYGEKVVNQIGVFGIPGDNANDHGLTVWMPNSIYGSIHSEKKKDILRFMEFYVSDEALDIYAEAVLPDGPYCIKEYMVPEDSYDGVKNDMQRYFKEGKTRVAMEFETAIKGANCSRITQSLITGSISGKQAAIEYDKDCKKQAVQLGFQWD